MNAVISPPPSVDSDDTNTSGNEHFHTVLHGYLSRRGLLKGAGSAAALLMGGGLAGCDGDDNGAPGANFTPPAPSVLALNFEGVPKSLADALTVPPSHTVSVLYALGDPIASGVPAYSNVGTDSGASFAQRAGDHHDGMEYFGVGADGRYSATASDRGLLVMNHENITAVFLHAAGPTVVANVRTVPDEALKEINCHGVAVIEVVRSASGAVTVQTASPFNRRITPNTPMRFSGPAAGSSFFRTEYSPTGTDCRGTLNNCATGRTPWGTFLTCEENWSFYFHRAVNDNVVRGTTSKAVTSLTRYLVPASTATTVTGGPNFWFSATASDPADTTFRRFNASQTGVTADGTDDFRNEPNTFGYVVEIDPFTPNSVPRKRTALGRLAHEAAAHAAPVVGKPLAFYMGDDSRNEYIYKYVSTATWSAADATAGATAGDKYLDAGTLYVARFNADGTGAWLPLTIGNTVIAGNTVYPFADQADICVNTRLAADAVGATRMDRPEWSAVNPKNGDVYFTLTNNNTLRSVANADAANPRSYLDPRNNRGNPNGHIIRLRETGGEPGATTFQWDIYLFGARANMDPTNVNVSILTDANDFSSPDGLWFDNRGLCWIQTDDGAYTDVTNCMMLAAIPGAVGDGTRKTITNTDGTTTRSVDSPVGKPADNTILRRFLVGPRGCEITGIAATPDYRTLFVNIQHPGEETTLAQLNAGTLQSSWPGTSGARPRSATVVIRRQDGGTVGAVLV